jgi:hypothetical protein
MKYKIVLKKQKKGTALIALDFPDAGLKGKLKMTLLKTFEMQFKNI